MIDNENSAEALNNNRIAAAEWKIKELQDEKEETILKQQKMENRMRGTEQHTKEPCDEFKRNNARIESLRKQEGKFDKEIKVNKIINKNLPELRMRSKRPKDFYPKIDSLGNSKTHSTPELQNPKIKSGYWK